MGLRSFLILALFSTSGALAQGVADVIDSRPRDVLPSRRRVRALRVETPPVIDGRLDEPAWSRAVKGGELRQVTPVEGKAPSERTEFRVLFDTTHLYLGVWCFDENPKGIVATELARDRRAVFDDHVTIVLDTFRDRRNGYEFRVNPNGARDEGLITNNSFPNHNWDTIWRARARIDDDGWFAEIAIPFKSIAFAEGVSTWGFNLHREVRRKNELLRWSAPQFRYRTYQVAEGGDLVGLKGIEQGLGLQVTPYAISRLRDQRQVDDRDTLFDGGLDLRYSLASNLTASMSFNTDFAETEVDERQVNLTRFPLFFREKREFFLQDAGIFSFGDSGQSLIPFFSRRVGLSASGAPVPISLAAKLTGRAGDYNIGVLDAALDGPDGLMSKNVFVARVSRNVLDSSSIGAIVTHGDPNSENENLVVGGDFKYRNSDLFDGWVVGGDAFVLGSWTEGRRGDDNSAASISIRGEHEAVFTSLKVFQIDEDFQAALGFVPRKGVRRLEQELTLRPLLPSIASIRRVYVSYFGDYVTNLDNELQTSLHSLSIPFIAFESGDELFFNTRTILDAPPEEFEVHPGVVLPPGKYWWQVYRFGFFTSKRRLVDLELLYEPGRFYGGTKQLYQSRVSIKPSKYFFLDLSYALNEVQLPQGNFRTRLASVRAQVNFSPNLAWFNLLQYDDISDSIGLNSRVRWEFRPGGFLHLVLGQSIDRLDSGLRVLNSELTVKVNVAFRF